jgi:hypothetical protein
MADGPALATAVQDAQGSYSSRRVGAFIALGCLTLGFLAVLACVVIGFFAGKTLPDSLMALMSSLVQVMAASVIGGLAFATADRWAPK